MFQPDTDRPLPELCCSPNPYRFALPTTTPSNSQNQNTQPTTIHKISKFSASAKQNTIRFLANDFDSDSDDPASPQPTLPLTSDIPLRFCSSTDQSLLFSEGVRLIDANDLILSKKTIASVKLYKCDVCELQFVNPAAKGGHMAKNHPQMSQKFKQRKFAHAVRKQERTRNKFFKSLKAKSFYIFN